MPMFKSVFCAGHAAEDALADDSVAVPDSHCHWAIISMTGLAISSSLKFGSWKLEVPRFQEFQVPSSKFQVI